MAPAQAAQVTRFGGRANLRRRDDLLLLAFFFFFSVSASRRRKKFAEDEETLERHLTLVCPFECCAAQQVLFAARVRSRPHTLNEDLRAHLSR